MTPDSSSSYTRRSLSLGTSLRFGLAASVLLAVAAAAGLAALVMTLPDVSALGHTIRHPSVTIRGVDGSLIATYGDLPGDAMALKDLPKVMPEAVIATEDRRFYYHFGIDPLGLARAAFANMRAGTVVQGGSTLTQQLAKNIFLTPDRKILRKLQETMLALWLEHRFSKDQILEIYLNRVYFGAGAYGVDAASRRYFGHSARTLSTYESAILAGLLKAPGRYGPAGNREKAAGRARQVLQNMVAEGYLTTDQAASAARQSAVLASVPGTEPGLRYFTDWIEDQLATGGYGGDLVVDTTINPGLQTQAETIVARVLAAEGTRMDASQAALVAMAPDGAIRAMVGGSDYRESQFNRVTQASRQPGSAFKPFVYLTALEDGMSPDDTVLDAPIRIGRWQPHNFSGRYQGEMPLREALANSINTVAVRLVQRVGARRVAETAHRLGITSMLPPDASIALGTGNVTLLELTGALCAFANDGDGAWSYGITEIRDPHGKVLFRRTGNGPGRVIDLEHLAQMNGMLAGVIDHGTGHGAQIGRWAAGKTGTTSDFRDAWFVGFTPDLVAGVWFGNDDNTPMKQVTGGTLPAHVWHDFMMAALKDVPVHTPAEPEPEPEASTSVSDDEAFNQMLKRVEAEGNGPDAVQ